MSFIFLDSIWYESPDGPVLEDWAVGFGYNCALLFNTAPRLPAWWGRVGVLDAIPGLLSRAPVCRLFVCWILRMDAGRSDYEAP